MRRFINGTAYMGRVALFLMLTALTVDILMSGTFFSMIELDTSIVSRGQEMWRLISYPFAMKSMSSVLLFTVVFLFFLPQLDDSLPKQIIAPVSFILVLFQSLIYTLAFWDVDFVYSGMDGISIFFLVLIAMTMPDEKIYLFGRRLGKVFNLATLFFVGWVSIKLISFEFAPNKDAELLTTIASVMFGFVTAVTVYSLIKGFHFYIQRKEASFKAVPTISPEKLERVYAENYVSSGTGMKQGVRESESESITMLEQISQKGEFTSSDEEIMNTILDKISLHGKESLNEDEEQSLLLLSKKIELLD